MRKTLLACLASALVLGSANAAVHQAQTVTHGDITYTITPVQSNDQLISGAQYLIRPLTSVYTTTANPLLQHTSDGNAAFIAESEISGEDGLKSCIWTAVEVPDSKLTSTSSTIRKFSFKNGGKYLQIRPTTNSAPTTVSLSDTQSCLTTYNVITGNANDASIFGTVLYFLQFPTSGTSPNSLAFTYYTTSTSTPCFVYSTSNAGAFSNGSSSYFGFYRVTVDDAHAKDFYQTDYETAKADYEAETSGKELTDGLNGYSFAIGNGEIKQDVADLDAMFADGGTFNESDYLTKFTAVEKNVSDGVSLNMPQTSRYLRIRTAAAYTNSTLSGTTRYLCSADVDATINSNSYSVASTVIDFTTPENEAATIMYYYPNDDYNGKLCAYDTGCYAYNNNTYFSFRTDASTNSNSDATNIAFQASPSETGTYLVRFAISDGTQLTASTNVRALGQCTDASSMAVGGGGGAQSVFASLTGFNFNVDYVSSLPVTIPEGGITTFNVKVPVIVPTDGDGVEFYVSKYDDGTMTVHHAQSGETYAANTGFIVKGTAGTTVHFTIADEGDQAEAEYADTYRTHRAAKVHEAVEGKDTYMFTPVAEATPAAARSIYRVEGADAAGSVSMVMTKLAVGDVVPANTPLLDIDADASTNSTEGVSIPLTNGSADYTVAVIDPTTSIAAVEAAAEPKAEAVYDLQGRRINAITRSGIYIVNGKKMIY